MASDQTAVLSQELVMRQLRVQNLMTMYMTSSGLGNTLEMASIKLQLEAELEVFYQSTEKWTKLIRG